MSNEHRARKRFGQNFLHDQNIIRRIVDSFNAQTYDNVIEIGPGQGAITQHLLEQVKHLHVLEIDRDLVTALKQRPEYPDNLSVHETDVLKFDFQSIEKSSLRIIGNLPYNISTPIIFHIVEYKRLITDMVFMLQKEVVDRMLSEANDKNYGRLSVMTQIHFNVEKLFDVSKNCFSPPPKVMSTVFRLRPRFDLEQQIQCMKEFSNVVQQAFNQRRKTIRNSLKPYLSEEDLENIGIKPDARPETLTLDDFILLANTSVAKKNQ